MKNKTVQSINIESSFDWFYSSKTFGAKFHSKLFWIWHEPMIVIGFYRLGVYLWNPFTDDLIAMRFGRFRREIFRKQLYYKKKLTPKNKMLR